MYPLILPSIYIYYIALFRHLLYHFVHFYCFLYKLKFLAHHLSFSLLIKLSVFVINEIKAFILAVNVSYINNKTQMKMEDN